MGRMQRWVWTGVAAAVLAAVCWQAVAGPPEKREAAEAIARLRADVKYLASDELQGRGIGSRGEELTIDFIAKEFKKAGLKPAGDRGGYFQAVPLVQILTQPRATLAAIKAGETIAFKLEEEFVGTARTQQSEDFDAEAIFVGHGITAPEFGWDDYQGVDVKDKVVIAFTNEPPSDDPKFFGGKGLTYYGRWTYKYEEATRRGARAVLIIHTNETAGYPYGVVRTLKSAQLERKPGAHALAFAGWLSHKAGDKLLGLAGLDVAMALAKADQKGFRAIPLGVRVKGHIPTVARKIVTRNVIGVLEGSDPKRKDEAVMFTAHWDHLGIGKAVVGADDIYNGAVDNASGTAILLELARRWAGQNPRPRRSALFLAATAEESGLLGSLYYAQNPIVPLGKTAIDLNFDGVLPLGIPESVVLNGAERTTVWPTIQKIAERHKLTLEPDKMAHQGFFYRSDHFSLARHGVPAFSIYPGERIQGKPAGYGKKAVERYIAKKYHTPQDEYGDDWDLSGYPVLIEFAVEIARTVANAEKLPTWNPGDEFLKARQ